MKYVTITAIIVMLGVLSAQADSYLDPVGDDKWGTASMDITQVELNNNTTDLQFTVTLGDGAAFAADAWAKIGFGIDSVAGGSTTADAWNDKIIMSSGMDFWGGGWTDTGLGAGINVYNSALGGWPEWQYGGDGSTWAAYDDLTISGNDVSFSIPLASLNLSVGDTFDFDVYTFWNDGSAEDALGLATTMPDNWQYDSGSNLNSYTVIPEPATLIMALVGAGALFASRRIRS